jgi:hypothetical protein
VTINDPGVDAAVVIGGFARGDEWQGHIKAVAELSRKAGKPILQVAFGSSDPVVDRALAQAGIASFASAERALRAYALARRRPPNPLRGECSTIAAEGSWSWRGSPSATMDRPDRAD